MSRPPHQTSAAFSAAFLLAVASSLSAQDTTATPSRQSPRWGVGVALNPTALVAFDQDFLFLPIGFGNFVIPIHAGSVTWEPEFGLFKFSTSSSGGGFSSEDSFTNLRLGLGILFDLTARGDLHPYFGPRLGIARSSSKSTAGGPGTSSTQTNWYIGAALGAQHYFASHFSLGGEVQLTRTSLGEPKTEPPSSGSQSGSMVHTTALMLLRWYF